MSIHPSLKSSEQNRKQRSILKRTERLRMMMEKGEWKEGDDVYGLPKIKAIKLKIKKEKVAEKSEAAATAGGVAAAPVVAKEQAPAKGAAAKSPERK